MTAHKPTPRDCIITELKDAQTHINNALLQLAAIHPALKHTMQYTALQSTVTTLGGLMQSIGRIQL